MARFADSMGVGPNPYDELLAHEEETYARRGGRLVLVGNDQVVRQFKPGPLLAALRAGQPVEVPDWRVPRWARPGSAGVRNVRLRLHPEGWVEDVEA
jgi:hypothetical protein